MRYLRLIAWVSALLLPVMLWEGWGLAASQEFAGKKITVVTLEGAQSQGVEAVVPLFEKATGAKVEVVKYPWGSLLEKVMMDFSTGMGTFDIVVMTANQIGAYAEANFIQPIEKYVNDPAIADRNLNLKDFSPALLDIAKWKGRLYGLPFKPDMQLLFYRKDLFESPQVQKQYQEFSGKKLSVPGTTTEFLDVARFFTKKYNPKSPTQYGTAVMAKKGNQTTFFWTPRLFALGGSFFTKDMRPAFDNAAGVDALQYMLEVLKYSPPESSGYDFPEANAAYLNGDIAMLEQWIEFAASVEDPKKSKVVGKQGYTIPVGVMKGGKVSQGSNGSSWNSFVTTTTKEPILAYKFAEFLTMPEAEMVKLPRGVMPVRNSTLSRLQAQYPFFDALKKSWAVATFCKPDVPESEQLLDVLRTNFSSAAVGQMNAQQAIKDAAEQWRQILHKGGYF